MLELLAELTSNPNHIHEQTNLEFEHLMKEANNDINKLAALTHTYLEVYRRLLNDSYTYLGMILNNDIAKAIAVPSLDALDEIEKLNGLAIGLEWLNKKECVLRLLTPDQVKFIKDEADKVRSANAS